MASKKRILVTTAIVESKRFRNNIDILMEDSDDEDEIFNLLETACQKTKPLRIKLYVETIVMNYSRVEFQQHFRMGRNAFENLLERYVVYVNTNDLKVVIPLEKQLLSVIWLLATPESYRSVGDRFDLAKSTLSVIFCRVIKFLIDVSKTIIKFPNNQEKNAIKNYFKQKKKIDGIIGAIDGAYINVKAPKNQKMAYTNRKCGQSVTLQAVCDNRMKYLDVFVGYPSSVHDNRIFRNSPFFKKASESEVNPFFEPGEKLLGDKAYPVLPGMIPPYINRRRLSEQQIYFNKVHASLRIVIEHSFALFFGRFRRLRYLDINKTDLIPSVVVAACVLHNICLDFDEEVDTYLQEGLQFVALVVPNDNETNGSDVFPINSGIQEREMMTQSLWANRNRRNH